MRREIIEVRLHDINSSSSQRPFGHTVIEQADYHNTQRLEVRVLGRGGGGRVEECLVVEE